MTKALICPSCPTSGSEETRRTLKRVGEELGGIPNLYLTAALSPAALQSLWAQVAAAAQMTLVPRLRELVALRVSQFNGCSNSLACHTKAASEAGVDAAKAIEFRRGVSNDVKEQALLNLVSKVLRDRGHHGGFEVEEVRKAGLSDAEVVEVIALVGLYTYTNYLDCVANTPLDYPPVEDLPAASTDG